MTEFNPHTASVWETLPTQTIDDADAASMFAAELVALAPKCARAYAFKFSQTPTDRASGVAKNGLLFGESATAPYNIGGSSRSAEALGLIARRAASKLTFTVAATSTADLKAQPLLAVDDAWNYYLYSASDDPTNNRDLTVVLDAWNVSSGASIVVNEVSAARMAEVAAVLTVPASGSKKVSFLQQANSLLQFVVPKKPTTVTTLAPAADATVKAGANSAANYGSAATLEVGSGSAFIGWLPDTAAGHFQPC